MRWTIVTPILVAAAGIATATAFADDFSTVRFRVPLTGAEEVPGPGDPDGYGRAVLEFKAGRQLCYTLITRQIAPATMAHIHVGPAGVAGPVVVNFQAPTSGQSQGCTPVAQQLVRNILNDPDNYYVNVHNAAFPAGAVRGQLE